MNSVFSFEQKRQEKLYKDVMLQQTGQLAKDLLTMADELEKKVTVLRETANYLIKEAA